jgi:hypothetical protein
VKNSIFACLNPIEKFWQLGCLPPAHGTSLILIGWYLSTSIDGGLPEKIADILARATTSAANAVFLSSDVKGGVPNEWKLVGEDAVCVLKEPNPLKFFLNSLSGRTSDLVLLSTRKPENVVRLFDDGIYSWWLQGQVVLLSEPEQTMPEIDRQTLLSLFEDDWTQQALHLQSTGTQCVMRPGVDGSVAGLLFLTDDFRSKFLQILGNESRADGFELNLLPETDFVSSIAIQQM